MSARQETSRPRVENARRLTGRGFFASRAGAAVELWLAAEDGPAPETREVAALGEAMAAVLDELLPRLGLEGEERRVFTHARGLTVAVTCPIDRAMAWADALEWAAFTLSGETTLGLDEAVQRYHEAAQAEADPRLVAWEARAAALEVPFLWDDDEVSFGLGAGCGVFPARALPPLEAFDAGAHRGRIPVGLVTGTNGKTTTTRMAAAILKAAGYRVGATGTDAITLDGVVLEAGDWTGPGAARKVLRHPEVTAAVLEAARGGILRRGLGFSEADAALVTNVGSDHMGEYGIASVEAMAGVKAVVWQGVRAGGRRIANLDCAVTMAYLERAWPEAVGGAGWVFCTQDASHPSLARHRAAGGEAWFVDEAALVHARGAAASAVLAVEAIPATLGGAARHNVANALAAAALASAMGAEASAVAAGLARFGADPDDNPGRLERYERDGVRLVLDFAHNPHGVHAIADSLRGLRGAGRLFVSVGQAGDRSQAELDALAREVVALAPDAVWLRPMPGYERGRTVAETVSMLRDAFSRAGLEEARLDLAESEVDFLQRAVAVAGPGDLVALLVHYQRAEVRAWLVSAGGLG